MDSKKLKRFTYGHQFEPAKFSLVEILELCKECQPSRDALETNIAQHYFSQHSKRASSRLASSDNISKLAMNCFLSLRAYQLIEDLEQPRQYKISPLAEEILSKDRFVYSRWQIQCKNTNKVDIDVLAKEIGLTFVTGADVVMVVTTGEFTRDAYQYAYRMMEVSRYYMILLQKDDIEAIKRDKTNIVEILDRKARRVFAKKELDVSDEELNEIEYEEDLMARAIEDEIDDNN
jgi:Restriction endonuclease